MKEHQVRDKATLHLVFERFDPSFPRWLGFLAGFVVPQAYFQSLGPDDQARAEEFARKPVGSGPYRVVSFTPGSTLVLEAFDRYWKGAPPIKRAVFKMVTDPTARVAEILSGNADITSEVPVEEFGRLSTQASLKGMKQPVGDMAQIFLNPRFEPFKKEEVRLAVHYAIDKKTIVDKVLLGFGMPRVPDGRAALRRLRSELLVPVRSREGPAAPPDGRILGRQSLASEGDDDEGRAHQGLRVHVRDHPDVEGRRHRERSSRSSRSRSGSSIRTARGQGGQDLAPLSLYFWSNPTGDPINSVGFQNNVKGPFRVWESEDLVPLIDPIFDERDEPKRIAAAKKAARYVVEKGYVVPLFQVVQPVVMKKDLNYQPFPTGVLIPQEMSWA